jgi:hypothetical protein
VAQNPRHTLVFSTSSDMFAVIVRFQELTSSLNPLPGYFGRIDGGQLHSKSPTVHAVACYFFLLFSFFLAKGSYLPGPLPHPPASSLTLTACTAVFSVLEPHLTVQANMTAKALATTTLLGMFVWPM